MYIYDASSAATANGGTVLTLDTLAGRLVHGETTAITVKTFGAVGGGIIDDTSAFLAFLLSQKGILDVPLDTYKLTAGIAINVSDQLLKSSGSTLDFSAMTGTYTAIELNGNQPADPYGQNAGGIDGFRAIGDGKTGSGTGILENGTSVASTCAHSSVKNCAVSLFGVGRETKTNGYVVKWYNSSLFRNGVAYKMVSGGTNYGEGLSFVGCAIFNNDLAFQLSNPNASVQLSNSSIDYNYALIDQSAGTLNLNDCHVEFDGAAQTATPFRIGSNEAMFVMNGGTLLASASTWVEDYVVDCAAPSRAIFNNVRMFGMESLVAFDTGTGQTSVINPHINTVSRMTPWRARGELFDVSFETGSISSNIVFISSDTAAITSRITGTNLALTLDTSEASSGTQSLRAAKLGGVASASAFSITVPAAEGDMYAVRFKCINNGSRGATNIFATNHFSNDVGPDSNGVPQVSIDAAHATKVFTPTNIWEQQTATSTLQGAQRCPSGRNSFTLVFNLVNFEGGAGAAEGGNYSLYFDEIEIYRWGS